MSTPGHPGAPGEGAPSGMSSQHRTTIGYRRLIGPKGRRSGVVRLVHGDFPIRERAAKAAGLGLDGAVGMAHDGQGVVPGPDRTELQDAGFVVKPRMAQIGQREQGPVEPGAVQEGLTQVGPFQVGDGPETRTGPARSASGGVDRASTSKMRT